jgi:ABC-2 type transport system permease protein
MRLVTVELRKMVDTRAGFWLQLTVVLLTLAVAVAQAVSPQQDDETFAAFLGSTVGLAGYLLPVIGVLLVTSEWNQRTALITFALVPHRSRVLAAKLGAGLLLALAALVVCVVFSAAATACSGPGGESAWRMPAGLFGQIALSLAVGILGGIGFGAAMLASAPAIVLFFLLPIAWSLVGTIRALRGAARWLDGSLSLTPMTEHLLSSTEWARAGTTLAVWMALPILIGLWRITRGEIR